jgi:hypothetical protein
MERNINNTGPSVTQGKMGLWKMKDKDINPDLHTLIPEHQTFLSLSSTNEQSKLNQAFVSFY